MLERETFRETIIKTVASGTAETVKIYIPCALKGEVVTLTSMLGEISTQGLYGPIFCILQVVEDQVGGKWRVTLDRENLRIGKATTPYFSTHAHWEGALPLPADRNQTQAIGHYGNDTDTAVDVRTCASWIVERNVKK